MAKCCYHFLSPGHHFTTSVRYFIYGQRTSYVGESSENKINSLLTEIHVVKLHKFNDNHATSTKPFSLMGMRHILLYFFPDFPDCPVVAATKIWKFKPRT